MNPVFAASRQVTGERVTTSAGRLQPNLASPRRRLPGMRLAAAGRGASSTSDAGWATATTCWLHARRSGSTSIAAALEGQDRETHVADMRALPFEDGDVRCRARGPVDRARARSRAGPRRGSSRAASGRDSGVRDAQPPYVRPARRDHRSLPLRRVLIRRTARNLLLGVRAGRESKACSDRRGTSTSSHPSAPGWIACCEWIRCGCGAWFRGGPGNGCTTACSRASAPTPIRRRPPSTRPTSDWGRGPSEALDLVAVCSTDALMEATRAVPPAAPRRPARRGRGARVRGAAPALALEADLLARRMGGPAAPPLLEHRHLLRSLRGAPDRAPDPDLQGAGRRLRHGLAGAVPARRRVPVPAQRRAPVHLREATCGGVGRPRRDPAHPLPRPLLGRPAVPVPDGPVRLDRVRAGRAARARPPRPAGDVAATILLRLACCSPPSGFLSSRARRWTWRCAGTASAAPSSSPCRRRSTHSGT